jgi:hypothetical protein
MSEFCLDPMIEDNYDDYGEQALCYKKKQKQSEAQLLELTYGHLGRLMQSAEMLAYKLRILGKENMKYQGYDSFGIADKKKIDTIKYDIINFLDFYEKAISIHNAKYSYQNPRSIGHLISDLIIWENNAPQNDKRFFHAILDLIQKGKYDISVFPDEDDLYEKAKKDNAKFKDSPGFWKNFSVPILNYLKNLLKKVQEKEEQDPNYKPDIHFGGKPMDNEKLIMTYEYSQKEREINSKLNEINLILVNIEQKKEKAETLVKASEELNVLYKDFTKIYGNSINLDQNAIKIMKSLIAKFSSNKRLCNKLNDFFINIDPDK